MARQSVRSLWLDCVVQQPVNLDLCISHFGALLESLPRRIGGQLVCDVHDLNASGMVVMLDGAEAAIDQSE